MVAIRDNKSDTFTPPSFFRHTGQAIRGFIDAIERPQPDQVSQLMHRYPADYDLFEIGTYDDNTGTCICNDKPVLLYNGSNVRPQGE